MLQDQLVLPVVMTQTAVKRRLLVKKPPKKLFPSEILFNFSELSRCFSVRGTQRQFSGNICSEDDLRSRIFGTFVVNFVACLPLLGFSNI